MEEAQDIEEAPTTVVSKDGLVADFLARYPQSVLETLLLDRTTGRNIVWADDEYVHLGEGFGGDDEVTLARITGEHAHLIKLRTEKASEHQSKRTKSRAEVFTPSWLCNYMNNRLDDEWFGRPGAFNAETGEDWEPTPEKVEFPTERGRGWGDYVRSTRLEITCGEAPFLCSRYDTVTGEAIPVPARIGVLDRKLRVVGEHARSRAEWAVSGLAALRATYGYEYQGDNLLIARINVLETLAEHFEARWGEPLGADLVAQAAEVVSWNLWQMDGLTCTAPTNAEDAVLASVIDGEIVPREEVPSTSLFDWSPKPRSYRLRCIIRNWKANEPFEFAAVKGQASQMAKKFYAVIGNPPYQEEFTDEGNRTFAAPLYDKFMDEAYAVSEKVELITPARFLFDAGRTPRAWNRKMLADSHLKVIRYEPDASVIFADNPIPGGIAITYRDRLEDFGAIKVFTAFNELNGILQKVAFSSDFQSIVDGFYLQNKFKLDKLFKRFPVAKKVVGSDGKDKRFRNNIFEKLPEVFSTNREDETDLKILGVINRERAWRYIANELVDTSSSNIGFFKLLFSAGDGAAGTLGKPVPARVLPNPLILNPGEGFTQSFITYGSFETAEDADRACLYFRSKFLRTLAGICKTTQHITPDIFKYVPLQDFTPASDIDWSRPVAEIDRQLYAKYGLDDSEVEFIETHVKEMG
ncbi:Eco57I restriction-modification methylase domain-containing protein [Paratractidigestivibacter sp.]|uniref:Eco57I restriction-modification methylase domain-containing protein n=1 Tax=Paratractidigestivibacter sp. TaxID=2847316 RepID=UPI002AC8F32B|nr:Eco57I restriction-modification methylase domain-containing protein [Paratractidigestivibacter sp.]